MKAINDVVFKWLRHRKRVKDLKAKTGHLLDILERNDRVTRAMILAMSAVFRARVIDRSSQLSKALNYSDKMSKERIGLIFELLLAIQSKMIQEKSALDQKLEALEIKENASVTHWDKSLLGMDIWMVTIGSGYTSRIGSKVLKVWTLLDDASNELDQAIPLLRELEDTVNDLSPATADMYGSLTDDQWVSLCAYRPGLFKGR
ncbi:MAG: hypothetical protein CSB48_11705 [Proteobacteria bacterium]|nr:MAG: hypothetical protein CSB48_11705 [Pseudomonadota bacterium]PIE40136.1 MAG: hypothetical protein CSA51_02560 [Gammaproteobacteria bacterium]